MRKTLLFAPLILSACTTPVIKDRVETVKVPVTVPCVKDTRPEEVKPLKQTMSKQQWDALTLDQREKLLLGNGMARKTYGDQLYVATSGCL